jgi:hypothetical protein
MTAILREQKIVVLTIFEIQLKKSSKPKIMKIVIIIMCLLGSLANSGYIIINDILYKMPDREISKIKTTYHVKDKDVTRFEFNKDSCFVSVVECVNIKEMTPEDRESWREYAVDIPMLFLYEGKLVTKDHFHPSDIKSMRFYPKKEAIQKYGCKGLATIFILQLKEGKTIQSK